MAKRQIGHRKSCLVLSARFPVANLRSRPVAKSAYYSKAPATAFVVLFVVIINVIIVFHVRKSFTVTVVSCCFVQHQNTEKRGKDFSKITKFSLLLIHCNDLNQYNPFWSWRASLVRCTEDVKCDMNIIQGTTRLWLNNNFLPSDCLT